MSKRAIELNSTDSEVLGTVDSLSLPTEPPDLNNWFSSYMYESPVLNTLEGFQDSHQSKEHFSETVKLEKLYETRAMRMLATDNGGAVDSAGLADDTSAPEVFLSMDAVSLPSEPSDLKNWFSSYTYKSPQLSTMDGFEDSQGAGGKIVQRLNINGSGEISPTVRANGAEVSGCPTNSITLSSVVSDPRYITNWLESSVYGSPPEDATSGSGIPDHKENKVHGQTTKSRKEKEEDLIDPIVVKQSYSIFRSGWTTAIAKCRSMVKDDLSNGKDMEQNFSVLSEVGTSPRISQQILVREKKQDDDRCSLDDSRETSEADDRDAKMDSKLACMSCKLLGTENNLIMLDSNSSGLAVANKGFSNVNLEAEDCKDSETIPPGSTLSSVSFPKGKSSEPTVGSYDKENEGPKFPEDGFVSTRTSRSSLLKDEKTRRPLGIQSESSRNGASILLTRDANIRRKVLSEIIDIQQYNDSGITGKWHCPQRTKPQLRPPLKQLRLEQWIRRV